MKLPGTTPAGEDLTIDIGWFGAPHPARVLVHSSGLHGVEGYAGSAIQLQWLAEGISELPGDAAIVIVHLLNPYGCAWTRRVNEHNVDLNRNFRAPGDADDNSNDGGREYPALDAFLNPRSAPRRDFFYARAAWLVMRHGMSSMRQAVAGGQRTNSQGLFYLGTHLEPGPRLYQEYLKEKLAAAQRIVATDVHTGLGRRGEDTLLVHAAPERARANATMRQAFGARTQLANEEGIAYRVSGAQEDMYYRLFPAADVHFATQEFGTVHALHALAALRAENRWHHFGSGSLDHPAKRSLLAAFCPDDEAWRAYVLRRGREVVSQACGLAFGKPAPQ